MLLVVSIIPLFPFAFFLDWCISAVVPPLLFGVPLRMRTSAIRLFAGGACVSHEVKPASLGWRGVYVGGASVRLHIAFCCGVTELGLALRIYGACLRFMVQLSQDGSGMSGEVG